MVTSAKPQQGSMLRRSDSLLTGQAGKSAAHSRGGGGNPPRALAARSVAAGSRSDLERHSKC